MEHAFSRIVALFLALLMLFLVPLVINMQRQEGLVQLSIMQDTVQFVDSVRNMGVLTSAMYEKYQNQVRRIQSGLEIHMVHTSNHMHVGEQGIEVVQKIYTEAEVIEGLEEESCYSFQKGDYFRVEVKKKTPGFLEKLFKNLYRDFQMSSDVYVYYGGSIRYEVR